MFDCNEVKIYVSLTCRAISKSFHSRVPSLFKSENKKSAYVLNLIHTLRLRGGCRYQTLTYMFRSDSSTYTDIWKLGLMSHPNTERQATLRPPTLETKALSIPIEPPGAVLNEKYISGISLSCCNYWVSVQRESINSVICRWLDCDFISLYPLTGAIMKLIFV